MSYQRSVLSSGLALVLILASSPAAVLAQGTPASATALPRVYVHDLTATVTGANTVTGSFTVENTELTAVGNLHYEISIIGPRPQATTNGLVSDTPLVYARSLENQPINLLPQQQQVVSFTHQAPSLPTGPYRLRVQLTTSNGRQLGWRDAPITLGGADNFVVVQPKALMVQSTSPADPTDQRDTWAPFEGVNVDPGVPVTLRATVNYSGALPLKVIPLVTITRLFAPATQPTTTSGELLTVVPNTSDETLPVVPDNEQTLNIPITAPTAPGSYQVMISLQTEQRATVSNLAEFRLVTRGVSASIVTASLRELPPTGNSPAIVDFLIAGPADRQSVVTGTLEAALYDNDTIVSKTMNTVVLGSAAQPGTAQLELPGTITGTPRIQLTLKDPTGATLDTYDVPVTGRAAETGPAPGPRAWAWGVAGGVFIIILAGIYWLWRKRRVPPAPLVAMLAVTVGGALMLGVGSISYGQTSGIQFADCFTATPSPSPSPSLNPNPSLEPTPSTSPSPSPTPNPCQAWNLFVNLPDTDDRSQVPYDARFEWFVSGNSVSDSVISVYALGGDGGTVTDRVATNPLPTSQALERTIQFTTQQPAGSFTVTVPAQQQGLVTNLLPWLAQARGVGADITDDTAPSLYFSGTFNLSNLPLTTSLWTEAMGNVDSGSTVGVIDDFFWLTPPPVPSAPPPGGSPTASPSPTVPPGCLVVGRTITAGSACQQARVSLSLHNTCSDTAFRIPLDIMLALDRSGSMQFDDKMINAQAAAKTLIDQLDPAVDRVGLVSYASTGRLDAQLTNDFTRVKLFISGLVPLGGTNIGDGVFIGRTELQTRGRTDAVPIIIVLTDGIANNQHNGPSCTAFPTSPTACTNDAINQAAAAKQAGHTVFTVGLGLNQPSGPYTKAVLALARGVLQEMASAPDQFYDAPTSDELTQVFIDIANKLKEGQAENTIITDILAPGVHYVLDSADPPPTSTDGQTLTWDVGTVTGDQEPRMNFTITFDQDSADQPISVYPDSQTTYVDGLDQTRRTTSPLSRYTPKSCTPPPQCSDAKDNDGDGNIDCDDIGCRTKPADASTCDPTDNDETDPVFNPGPVIETE